MEIYKPVKADYMVGFQRHEPVILDSTAMMAYKTCPTLYFFQIVLGFRPKQDAPYFAFGAAYHKFREHLERFVVEGKTEQEAFLLALQIAVDHAAKHLPSQISDTKWDFLTVERLKTSCGEAFKHWLAERINGKIKVIAYEQPFTLQMDDGTWIAGRADQIVEWNRELWGRDFKTSSKTGPWYSRGLEPNDQFTRYTWAESKLRGWNPNDPKTQPLQVKGQIVEVLFNDKKNGPKIEVYTTTRTQSQLKRWEREHHFWKEMIDKSRDEDMYPMNEKSCSFCPFHSVCKAPTESGKMSQLKTYFKVQPWDCTNVPD
jgi:hypothetical protein